MTNKKELVIIACTIFLTIVSWVILELKAITDKTPTNSAIESVELDYRIDTNILDNLKNRTP